MRSLRSQATPAESASRRRGHHDRLHNPIHAGQPEPGPAWWRAAAPVLTRSSNLRSLDLSRWRPGTTRAARRYARSCSASTWPPSVSCPPRSSRMSAPTHQDLESHAALAAAPARGVRPAIHGIGVADGMHRAPCWRLRWPPCWPREIPGRDRCRDRLGGPATRPARCRAALGIRRDDPAETYGDLARIEQLLDEHASLAALDPGQAVGGAGPGLDPHRGGCPRIGGGPAERRATGPAAGQADRRGGAGTSRPGGPAQAGRAWTPAGRLPPSHGRCRSHAGRAATRRRSARPASRRSTPPWSPDRAAAALR
jgi:hypothetical protein